MTGTATRQNAVVDALSGGECLTTAALVQLSGLERRAVADACCKLVYRGWIVRRERGCFELSETGRKALEAGETLTSGPVRPLTQKAPRRLRKRTARDAIWSAIVTLKKFRIADLETFTEASHNNALRYVRALEQAGYLSRLRPEPGAAPTSNGFVRWLLIRHTGPAAPVYRVRRSQVYDRNTGETHSIGRAS